MKKIIKLFIFLIIVGSIYIYKEDIARFIANHFIIEERVSDTLIHNNYFLNKKYKFVSLTSDFTAKEKKDLINIFYTVLNSGMEEFTFYCSYEYTDCIKDIDAISNDRVLLSNINNFVHPYNNFQDVETTRYESSLKITFKINYTYDQETIKSLDNKIEQIISENITNEMTDNEKIKVIHDYIINNTKYDSKKSDEFITNYKSDIAYGPLFEGFGLCSGYADAMQLFLNKMNIPSIKIASENHIWNLVYINNEWLHLDLTWDDPVLDTGKDIIDYEYYLITTDELYNKEDKQHFFDEAIYMEAVS